MAKHAAATLGGDEIVALSRKHTLFEWSAQAKVDPIPVDRAKGVHFWTPEGKRFIDLNSQLMSVNIGHGDERVIRAIQEQVARLAYVAPSLTTAPRALLGAKLAEIAPGDLDVFFFTSGGAEANENAVRIARQVTGRHKILARYRSYHGATGGAIALTGDPRRWPSEPGMAGVVHFLGPYAYRSSFGAQSEEEERDRALAHLEEVIAYEGAHTIAAIILEPIVGTNGILVPPDGYLQGVREVCDRHGIVMIADEVMAGFGRTGSWFATGLWDVTPDLITCAKGINSGYVPLGAVLISQRIADTFRDRAYPGGLTYSGHPLACASAVASIEVFREEGIVERSARLGEEVLGPELRELMERHPSVGDVRGRGCFLVLELVKDRETREMLVPFNASGEAAAPVARLAKASLERGLYLMTHWNVIMVVPPLTVTHDEVDEGLAVLDETLAVADEYVA
jgi:taurine---2-oxoglutarate transaminase